ncbi:cytochrome D1 domain-containing protein [Terriglobus roseus]|uniref:40-residue YVTN family beta-propeller repeat-containing protein n=1 Tax=Terriglobus roseus TaxID=392734 RepID=A0A1H4NI08_9BACT|nr:cytochrome D1 domain-containing protein [Terriglobus roseus]SEB94851.1 40-residue YVTN family beta-propeller repeat-containing protein [Terriglobus roseus]
MKIAMPFLAATALSAALLPALTAQTGSLLVLSKHDHTLAIVDPKTLKVTAKAPVGDDPHEVIASADGRTAWVSNYGGGWSLHTIAVIDLVRGKALPSIDLAPLRGAHGLAFADGRPWFTAEGSKVFGSVDRTTGKVDTVVGTGQDRTHMLWVAPDGKEVVTINVASATVSFFEQVTMRDHTDWTATVVPVGKGAEGFDLSPDGRELWVANAQDGTVSVIDRRTKKVTATLQANVKSVNRLKFTLDGRYAVLSLLGAPDLVILDAHTHAEVKRLPIGHGAAGIQMEPGGARAFVACTPDNYVAVIDLKTLTVASHIDVGGEPDGMDWARLR